MADAILTEFWRVLQEYDQHLAAVNSITFTDGGRRFLTSSDDKSMRVWEYGIPVVMKVRDSLCTASLSLSRHGIFLNDDAFRVMHICSI